MMEDNKAVEAEDIRLQDRKFTFDGRDFVLRCNMAVLADVQKACGGNLLQAISDDAPLEGMLIWLSAMMNDYADEQGWEDYEPYTVKTLGRKISSIRDIPTKDITTLVRSALFIHTEGNTDNKPDPQSSKN